MQLTANIHSEEGSYWADVQELPGCFASGHTLDELRESLREAVFLYLRDESARTVDEDSFRIGRDDPPRLGLSL